MPLLPTDYSKTIFYKIFCKDPAILDCYIGCTTNFINRKSDHKRNCNNDNRRNYRYYIYQFIRENGGWDNWDMVMLEECKCDNSLQAHAREYYWFNLVSPSLIKCVPNQTRKNGIKTANRPWSLYNRKLFIQSLFSI